MSDSASTITAAKGGCYGTRTTGWKWWWAVSRAEPQQQARRDGCVVYGRNDQVSPVQPAVEP